MKKLLLMTMLLICGATLAMAENQAEIKFDKLMHNFGKSKVIAGEGGIKTMADGSAPVVVCTFTFTNVGDAPLVINQAMASCGCTVPEYTKTPIQPGDKGEIKVTYNATGKFPGHFKKSITIRTNGVTEMVRLYIEGDMEEN